MQAAIENFAKMHGADKVLMLGGMMELGSESLQEHQHLIELINKYNWKAVVLVGGDFNKVTHSFTFFDNSSQAATWFKNQHFTNSNMLIKGSRSTTMEKVLE
jgi:UDP-N-acetylmuramoyl-tripeptide--D-alanyl-D-alanine ligase